MINMYLFIIFSIIVIFCFVTIIHASKDQNNCDNVTRKELKETVEMLQTQPTPTPTPTSLHTPIPTPLHTPMYTPTQLPYRQLPSPYLPYDPLYNLYSISPMSSLYTYLVEDHPHGFIERGPRGRSPRERQNIIQNFNTNFSGGHTGGRM